MRVTANTSVSNLMDVYVRDAKLLFIAHQYFRYEVLAFATRAGGEECVLRFPYPPIRCCFSTISFGDANESFVRKLSDRVKKACQREANLTFLCRNEEIQPIGVSLYERLAPRASVVCYLNRFNAINKFKEIVEHQARALVNACEKFASARADSTSPIQFFGTPGDADEALEQFLASRSLKLHNTWRVSGAKKCSSNMDRVSHTAFVKEEWILDDRASVSLSEHTIAFVPRIVCFDIETLYPTYPDEISMICAEVYQGSALQEKVAFLLHDERCSGEQVQKEELRSKDVAHLHTFSKEADLLRAWFAYLKSICPHVITGYNSNAFDVHSICERAKHHKIANAFPLSRLPDATFQVHKRTFLTKAKYVTICTFDGDEGILFFDPLTVMQMNDLLKHLRERSLNTVAADQLGPNEGKDELPSHLLYEYWRKSKHTRRLKLDYCIQDVNLTSRVFHKMEFLTTLYAEMEIVNLRAHAVCSKGQGFKTSASMDIVGRSLAKIGMMRDKKREENAEDLAEHEGEREHYLLHVGTPDAGKRECVLEGVYAYARQNGYACVNAYRKGTQGQSMQETAVLYLPSEADGERAFSSLKKKFPCLAKPYSTKDVEKISGGYVRPPLNPQMLETLDEARTREQRGHPYPDANVMVQDFKSLYPSVIQANEIDTSTVTSRADAERAGVKYEAKPRRHVLERGKALPIPTPAPGKVWPRKLAKIPWTHADVQKICEGTDYEPHFVSAYEVQLKERVTDETTVIVQDERLFSFISKALDFFLGARAHWKREMKKHEKGSQMHKICDSRQNQCKISANSMYGILLSKVSRLYSERCGAVIPQCGREANMDLSVYYYGTNWKEHFARMPPKPTGTTVTDEAWRNLCRLLADRFYEIRIVYGDTDSVFVHLRLEGGDQLNYQALSALNAYFCQDITRTVFGGKLELEDENVYVNCLFLQAKMYSAFALEPGTGRAEPFKGSRDEDLFGTRVLRTFGTLPSHLSKLVRTAPCEREEEADLLLEEAKSLRRDKWYARIVTEEDGTATTTHLLPRLGVPFALTEASLEEFCIHAGFAGSLVRLPKIVQKGLKSVRRNEMGAIKRLERTLQRCATVERLSLTEACETVEAMLARIACSLPPSDFFMSTRLSRNPGDGFGAYLRSNRTILGKKKRDEEEASTSHTISTEGYEKENKAMRLAFVKRSLDETKKRGNAQMLSSKTDEELGEEYSQMRMVYLIASTWTVGTNVSSHIYPTEDALDDRVVPSRLHVLMTSAKSMLERWFVRMYNVPLQTVRGFLYKKRRCASSFMSEMAFYPNQIPIRRILQTIPVSVEEDRCLQIAKRAFADVPTDASVEKSRVLEVFASVPNSHYVAPDRNANPRFPACADEACVACGQTRSSSSAFLCAKCTLTTLQQQSEDMQRISKSYEETCMACRQNATGVQDVEDLHRAVESCTNARCDTLHDRTFARLRLQTLQHAKDEEMAHNI